MKKLFVLTLVLGWAGGAQAALTLVNVPAEPIDIGETVTITVNNSEDDAYSGWLQIENLAVANFDGPPTFTPAGNPGGASTMIFDPKYADWYQFSVVSFPPNPAITSGDHILVNVIGAGEGTVKLNLFAENGTLLLDSGEITVVPEPATIALLGLGALLLRRRK